MSSVPEPTEAPFRHAAIVGLGVMGGSLARALAALADAPVRSGWSPDPAERDAALAAGALDHAPDTPSDAVRDADLVVLAAPLQASCALLAPLAEVAPPGAVFTDVCSLKHPAEQAARAAGLAARWAGSHPMAGSEGAGFAAGRADLYRGALVWMVAAPEAAPAAAAVGGLWERLGARVQRTGAAAHDAQMARVSHLPQLTATALATVLADLGVEGGALGPGGRDMTRLAASNPQMWRDLLAHAPSELAPAVRALADTLTALAGQVEAGAVDAIEESMRRTRRWRSGG